MATASGPATTVRAAAGGAGGADPERAGAESEGWGWLSWDRGCGTSQRETLLAPAAGGSQAVPARCLLHPPLPQ